MKRSIVFLILVLAICAGAGAAPDEDLLGKQRGYPVGTRANWFYNESVRVGSFSNLDRILPHNRLSRAPEPSALRKAAAERPLKYVFRGQSYSIDDYLDHQRTTALLIIKDGEIVVERYQYDRKPSDRFVSHSMAKSIVSLAVGFAVEEGRIRSLDDKVWAYVPALKGSAYGDTSIRSLLRMASGVRFVENYDGADDLVKFNRIVGASGTIAGLQAFGERDAAEGERFHYASIETNVLGVLMRAVTGRTLSQYVTEKLWHPMGAEAEATWVTRPDGHEAASGNFNATLRDYGRLGVLLANDGELNGKQILPREYLLEATDWHRHPKAFSPKVATPSYGYGYQFWTSPGETRRFALLGVYGQVIFVDPELKLVLVHTAAAKNARVGRESMGPELGALWMALVNSYGSW